MSRSGKTNKDQFQKEFNEFLKDYREQRKKEADELEKIQYERFRIRQFSVTESLKEMKNVNDGIE